MALSQQERSSFHLTPRDLQDKTLHKLNEAISFILDHISALEEKAPDPPTILVDSYANRDKYDAGAYSTGTILVYKDRGLVYQAQASTSGTKQNLWKYIAGTMFGDLATKRPLAATLSANDAGLNFFDTTADALSLWDGSAWNP